MAHEGPTPWDAYMREAVALSLNDDVFRSSNPRVGCVIVDPDGIVVGRGWHRGAGTPHAEIHALDEAGDRARGATAVVTLEPCAHTGRTGPCADALIDAGVARVVFAVPDPTTQAAGGGQLLRAAGIDVVEGVLSDEAARANRAWLHWQRAGRPLITIKCAMSLDGRVADGSGGPTVITGDASRAYSHHVRALVDAIVVGTGTVMVDDPHLTARDAVGALTPRQPMRVVVGEREIAASSRLLDDAAETLCVRSRDIDELLATLVQADAQHVLVEGGPTLQGALLDAGVVDEVLWFVAPVLLGDGPIALPHLASAAGVHVERVSVLGEDVLVEGTIGVHRDR